MLSSAVPKPSTENSYGEGEEVGGLADLGVAMMAATIIADISSTFSGETAAGTAVIWLVLFLFSNWLLSPWVEQERVTANVKFVDCPGGCNHWQIKLIAPAALQFHGGKIPARWVLSRFMRNELYLQYLRYIRQEPVDVGGETSQRPVVAVRGRAARWFAIPPQIFERSAQSSEAREFYIYLSARNRVPSPIFSGDRVEILWASRKGKERFHIRVLTRLASNCKRR